MRLVPTVARFFEQRLAEPIWRPVFLLRELYLRWSARRSRSGQDGIDLKSRFCPAPFCNFELHETGRVFLCCDAWLPTAVGNLNVQDADSIWNSTQAQAVRRSILDGSYTHCNHGLCGRIVENNLPTRDEARKNPVYRDIIDNGRVVLEQPATFISLMNDRSCNLTCPSCRVSRVNFTKGRGYEIRKRLQQRLESSFFSEPTDRVFTVKVTGSGDAFASRVFREFLYALDGSLFPNLKIELQTNGTLFNRKAWSRLEKIQGNISAVIISFDAATEHTYAVTRRGGDWSHLINNVAFLADLRRRGKIGQLILDFVVQKANFREMAQYIAIGKQHNADMIRFSKMTNWGTRSPGEYESLAVWQPEHPDYPEFCDIMAQPVFDDRKVLLGNLAGERERARSNGPR